ncbi:MAG: molybdopterin-dependent oxidoreductase [Chloroflexota bacterium]
MTSDHQHDPLRPHYHDPNPAPPSADPSFLVTLSNGWQKQITVADLQALPITHIDHCYIVSTGHGTSGPFTFAGTTLLALIETMLDADTSWSQVEVISADGFGNRVQASELFDPDPTGPILLSYLVDGKSLTREEGLVRMIVPSEKDDALRQVKWIGQVNILP